MTNEYILIPLMNTEKKNKLKIKTLKHLLPFSMKRKNKITNLKFK